MKLAIIDLAYGNIGSIELAFERLGVTPVVTADPAEIAGADRVVLPGVGAAGHAMRRIDELGLRDCLKSLAQPALGIRTDLPFKEAKGQLVELFEREYIVDLMKRHKMNLSAAAREAQIDRKHLRELIRKYGLDPRGDLTREEN